MNAKYADVMSTDEAVSALSKVDAAS